MKYIYSCLLVACMSGPAVSYDNKPEINASSFQKGGSTISGLINDHIPLGTAYDSQKNAFLNVQPVEGRIDETFGNTNLKFNTGIDMSYDELLNTLNGSVDADVNFSIVRVTAGASIAKEMASSSYSSSYTFSASSSPKKRLLLPKNNSTGYTLSKVGLNVANNYQSKIQDLVGDEFVSGIEYGASILINMKIEYGNKKDKSDIGGYLNVDLYGGVFKVGGQLGYLQEDTKSSVKITIRAIQQGGDPKQLLSIIPNNIITCSMSNPKPCFDMFKEAVDYSKNQFQSQLTELDDYNVVRYFTTRYDQSTDALYQLVPEYREIKSATKWLIVDMEDGFKEAILDEQRANQLLTSYFAYLPVEQAKKVEQIQKSAYDNAWFYFTVAEYCRDNPFGDSCSEMFSNMQNDCKIRGKACPASYDIKNLQLPVTEGIDWKQCELARQEAVKSGVVTEDVSKRYRQNRWAPTFIDSNYPALGILDWRLCEAALSTYQTSFN